MTDDLIAWLRPIIEGERDNIDLISSGGYAPDVWKTEPVNPHAYSGTYMDVWSYEREINEPRNQIYRDGEVPVALACCGRNQHLHVATYDPQRMRDEMDAKLAILDECVAAIRTGEIQPGSTWNDDAAGAELAASVLRLMSLPYASRPGYRSEWAP